MKLRILMATAAVGLAISGVAIAANGPAMAPAANSNGSLPAASGPMAATATTTTTTTTTAPAAMPGTMMAQSGKTVLDMAASNPNFSTLSSAIKAAGLEQALSGKGPITVFAPTNAAFAKLGPAKLNELMMPQNKAELTQILTYHVVPQTLPAAPTAQPTSLTTAEGQPLSVTKEAMGYQVQNARSEGATMAASNGSIIAIDSVLMPEASAKMGMAPSNSAAALPSTGPAPMPASMMAPATTSSTTTTTTIAPAAPATR